ncbi:MAG: hypothetical protein MJ120_00530 [Clostridia bacterium]|nr:hypothetical protein [Clostridia bacterium]
MSNKPLLIGYHTNAGAYYNKKTDFYGPAKGGGGVDFILCHHDPDDKNTVAQECESVKEVISAIKDLGADCIINHEKQNFIDVTVSADGFDWANKADGTHLVDLPDEYKAAMASEENFIGFMYDEFEHVIINRNVSLALASKFKTDKPAFPVIKEKDAIKQFDTLSAQLKEYAEKIKSNGVKMLCGEHVFPVLFHIFARNGIIPNFKSQKESFSNVQFAVAAGAALQYETPLFNCVDLWYRLTFPGHSVEEMKSNLKFAYLCGVNRVYVEAACAFYDKDDNQNEYGKAFDEFTKEYRGKERDYDIQDYKPEIGIIRYDDSFWGQGRLRFLWRNMLMGNPKIKADKLSKEWIKAFNIITHGETGNGGICKSRIELRSLTPHRSFASMNGAAVFDDQVKKEKLQSLKLCFLCGRFISDSTLEAVKELVKENGLTVVTTSKYAPDGYNSKKHFGFTEVDDGKGKWIITDNLKSRSLKNRLKTFLGEKGEMTYKFGEKTIKLKISSNGETFTVR